MRFRRFFKNIRRRLFVFLGVLLLCASCLFAFLDSRLTPLVRSLALGKASQIVNSVASDAVARYLRENGLSSGDFVTVCEDGGVRYVSVDSAQVNLLSADVSTYIVRGIEDADADFSVPVGNLFSGTLLAGRGRPIPVHILYAGGIESTVRSGICEAGINQTLHRVSVVFTVSITAVVGARDFSFSTEAENLICETVIVGDVPLAVVR